MLKFLADILKNKDGKQLACIKEIKRVGTLTIIRLKGDIDFDTISCVADNITKEMHGNFDRNILLDFKEVVDVDSSTLAYLITLLDKLQKKHRKLGFINTGKRLDNYLTIEKIDSIINKYDSEEEALKNLS